MRTRTLKPFELEDFFRAYEHRQDLINLASSDALAWTWSELLSLAPALHDATAELSLTYANTDERVVPGLRRFCGVSGAAGFNVIATNGAAEALSLIFQALAVQSNGLLRVALPWPSYGAFAGLATLCGLQIDLYHYRRESRWQLDQESVVQFAKTCGAVIVNDPHNPTGSRFPASLLSEIAAELSRHDGFLIVDEVFRFPGDTPDPLDMPPNCLRVGSLSKTYGLPGLRFGWIVAPESWITTLRSLQQYASLSINSFAAIVAPFVLASPETFGRERLLAENRARLLAWAGDRPDIVTISRPTGGTTVVVEAADRSSEDDLFHRFLGHKLLLVPGQRCFGDGDKAWFRLGYGGRPSDVRAGLEMLDRALERHFQS